MKHEGIKGEKTGEEREMQVKRRGRGEKNEKGNE